ncbi:hypothetical protein V5799_004563 [Amblyomma americanum]|uniref:Peptidase M13 N-terminal domain-containing protein n=1 Tax=Amblyomma americanum TaxID=6943 RepID=A0AAQ4D5R7_AMBAM
MMMFKTDAPRQEQVAYCETMDCRLHAKLLTAQLNASVDPCEDFSAYVCSGWHPPGGHREHIKTPIDAIALSRLAGFNIILAEGTRKLPAGIKALNMHKSCMKAEDHGGLYLSEFRMLMDDMGLSWPDYREDGDALDALIALSYKWQVHLWVEVRVLAQPHSGKWRLEFRSASVLPAIINQYQSVKDNTIYSAYWMSYYRDFNLDTNASAFTLAATINETREIEGAILNNLDKFILRQTRSPAVFRLGSIGNHSKPITSAAWMNRLQKNIVVSPQLAASYEIKLSHENLLQVVGSFFRDYPDHKILNILSWTFVQQYAPIADPRMLISRFGDRHKMNAYRPLFCGFHVEETYKVLVLSLDIAARIEEKQKTVIAAGFQRLVSAAVNKMESSSWLDDESKRIVREKMTSVKMHEWPDEDLMKNEELEEIYKDYPNAEGPFAEDWMAARRSIHNASEKVRLINGSQTYWEALRLPLNFAGSYPIYDYALGTLALPVYLLDTPLLYAAGTDAMFFGGLGFLLASNLARAVDKAGVRWLPNGTSVDSILSEEDRKTFREMDSCLESDGVESVFPELPALEIALAALEESIKSGSGSLYVQKDLPPVNAFFMTVCYMACTVHGFKSAFAADCNKIARNSAAFASAFKCSAGSKMNPEKKCTFFR